MRSIAWVIATLIFVGFALYWFFNWRDGKEEIGAEIELAPNRKPQWDDALLETKRLDMSLTAALAMLGIITVALPLYWLGEPGRHDGAHEFRESQAVKAGGELYEANCAQCHGSADGPGGVAADFSLVDGNGNFEAQVDWKAPSLATVLYRFSEDEVRYILNFGRSNSPMPAWGGPGGGPLTDQQVDNIIYYLGANQWDGATVAEEVEKGLPFAARDKVMRDNPDLALAFYSATADVEADVAGADAELDAIEAEIDAASALMLNSADADQIIMGELLFTNPGAAGALGCARCHSAGWSFDADAYAYAEEAEHGSSDIITHVEHGGGGLGPNLGSVVKQFDTATEMSNFIINGSVDGQKYGNYGQGDGGGQMPAFGNCVGNRDSGERDELYELCDDKSGMLTTVQIDAIVAYERSLAAEPEAPAPAPAPEPEPEPEPTEVPAAPTGVVNVSVLTDGDAVILEGEVLNEGQQQRLVDAAEAEYGAANVTDRLTILDVDPAIAGADDRVTELASLMPRLHNDLLEGQATLDQENLTVFGRAPSADAKDAVDSAIDAVAIGETSSTVSIDAASVVGALDLSGVQFDTGTANLTAEARDILDNAAAALATVPDAAVEVQGHTDDRGSDSSNQSLSQRRADAVVAYLVDADIDTDRLTAVGFGETAPIADNGAAEGRAENRRVEFKVLDNA